MELEKSLPPPQGEGCLVGVVRIPVKIVAMLVVLPVRVVWDVLVAFARMLNRTVFGPLGQGLARLYELAVLPVLRGLGWLVGALLKLFLYWPWVGLWRYVMLPAGHAIGLLGRAVHTYLLSPLGKGLRWAVRTLGMVLLVWPAVGLWRYVLVPAWEYVLAPVGRGFAWLVAGGVRYLLVLPALALYRYVLAPVGHGLLWLARGFGLCVAWLAMALFVWPWVGLWRYVLAPVGRGLYAYLLAPLGRLLVGAWHLAGRVSRSLWRGFVRVWRWLVVRPVAWAYRRIATPVGHAVRAVWTSVRRAARSVHRQAIAPVGRAVREVWNTSRLAVREARAEVRRALFGGPPREPARSQARTLCSNRAVDDAPATPIPTSPLHKPQG
ncbi:hypothetical protein J7F03_19070 [Streptomyces sp. ISL-43]|uniref:hypothetical protein n=1 Tax=Streptomyces sp. ISL-43 TaxID=2819183 RepID=UPI001BEC0632|nr:hypothetical protein [Streptomyces sp. ISL-43]MBT2449158.1 hypothetical protein [Streptomyces sp. ISL-43]